jgi:hypothetical protein
MMNSKIKLARGDTSGRHPSIKDGVDFQRGANTKKSHVVPKFVKEKRKVPMANDVHSSAKIHVSHSINAKNVHPVCRRFDPGGSLDRRVKLSLRAPA